MMRVLFTGIALSLVACVDGKTPDCSSVDTGCFPPVYPVSDASDSSTDAAVDAGDAGDAGNPSDAALDAPLD